MISITSSAVSGGRTSCSKESVMRAHPRGAATVGGACQGSPVRLTNGLAAPGCFDLLSADDRGKDTLAQAHFHPWWRTTFMMANYAIGHKLPNHSA